MVINVSEPFDGSSHARNQNSTKQISSSILQNRPESSNVKWACAISNASHGSVELTKAGDYCIMLLPGKLTK